MKFFRHITMIFAMVALAAGCTKTEIARAPEKEISFTVGSYAPGTKADTKASAVNNEFTSFFSKAFLHAEGVDETQDFFGSNGETITYTGNATNTWEPSHPYYWPKSEKSYINFVSWYANNSIEPTTVTETSFVVTREVQPTDNILIADAVWHYHANANQYFTTGVPTLFHHVLSRVQINMKASCTDDPVDANASYQIVLQSASLEGIYRRGTMTLTNNSRTDTGTCDWYSVANTTTMWKTSDGSNQTPFALASNLNIDTQSEAILEMRSFMPQVLGNGAKLNLTYTIVALSNGVETSRECDIPATIILNTITDNQNVNINQWLPNRKYNYTIAINPISKEIVLNPIIDEEMNWDDYTAVSAVVE